MSNSQGFGARPNLDPNFMMNNQQQQQPSYDQQYNNTSMQMNNGYNNQTMPQQQYGNNTYNNTQQQIPYQDPFSASQSMGFQPAPMMPGMHNNTSYSNNNNTGYPQQQQMNMTSSSGYQNPFINTINQQSYSNVAMPGVQSSNRAIFPPNIKSLSPQQTTFLKQIQTYLISHNKDIDTTLQKEHNVPLISTCISQQTLEAVGRQVRADILDDVQIKDLASQLIDPQGRAIPPENLSINALRTLLNQTGVSYAAQPQVPQKSIVSTEVKSYPVLREYLKTHKHMKGEELFEGLFTHAENGDNLVEREKFIKKLTEEVKMTLEESEELAKKFETTPLEGKILLQKFDLEFKEATVLPVIPKMTPEGAKTIVEASLDQMKRYLAMNEINIVDVFRECEKDDGYFNRTELSAALTRLSFSNSGNEHDDRIDAFFVVYDQEKTMKIDYIEVLDSLYKRANSKVVTEKSNRLFNVYETTRRFMRQNRYLSLGSIFLADYYLMSNQRLAQNVRQGLDIAYETNDFINQLTKIVGIKELDNYALQQSFVLALKKSTTEFDKIDYHKFADFVGYEKPQKSNKEEIRRLFYRTLLKEVGSVSNLEQSLRSQDINLQGLVQLNYFINVIEGYSPINGQDTSIIKIIAGDFADPQANYQINYLAFMQRVRAEVTKQATLQKVFRNFNEKLQFKDTSNLYGTLFAKIDTASTRKLNAYQFTRVLVEELGVPPDAAGKEVEQFFFEYDNNAIKTNTIKYQDIERDYQEYVEAERKQGKLPKVTNLPTILRMIRIHVDRTGQTLRQVFGKTKLGDNDNINQYQFTKIIHNIAMGQNMGGSAQTDIDDASIHLFMNEISTTTQHKQTFKDTKQAADNGRHVSFSELLGLYNMTFNIRDNDAETFVPVQVEKLINHIAKVALDNQRLNFDLRNHFSQYPQSYAANFIEDLKKEPLICGRDHPNSILEELGKKYTIGANMINTQMVVVDIECKVERLREKNAVFNDIRKQTTLKNQTIEQVFSQALPEVKKFKIEYLSPKEFFNVFQFLQVKISSEEKVRELLASTMEPDDQGKFSYLEFISEFDGIEEQKTTQARRGRRLYHNVDDVMKRIAFVIESRGLRNFGTLLADQDLHGKLMIEPDSFYRTIDSLQFALGEGDILDLIKMYQSNKMIDIQRFKEDLNNLIVQPDFKIELKSILHSIINERVVDQIDDASPRSSMLHAKVDQKTLEKYRILAREIVCGLYVKDSDAIQWFPKYATYKVGSVTNKEFQAAIEGLQATQMLEQPEQVIQKYYDFLLNRQKTLLGSQIEEQQFLLIEQLNSMINKDSPSQTRQKMIEDILLAIGVHITTNKLPLGDILKSYDTQGSLYMYRNDFAMTFLNNYLGLQSDAKQNKGLSQNQQALLLTRYAPNPSIVTFPYEQFVNDLKRKEMECRGTIKIFMTQLEADSNKEVYHEEDNQEHHKSIERVIIEDKPARSKRNTFVTEQTLMKPQLRGTVQIASFYFDDIMMATYRKGISVETYFSEYARMNNYELMISKEEFSRALASLGVEWVSNVQKTSEVFDSIDVATHGGMLQRYITPEDLAETVLLNAAHNVIDLLGVYITSIHKALKQRHMLSKLRDLFSFLNSRRDNTCQKSEFRMIVLEKLELAKFKIITETQVETLMQRYKNEQTEERIDFSLFLKDMEFCELGIAPVLIWAVDLAQNIIKTLVLYGYSTPEQLFTKFCRTQNIMIFDEFKNAFSELQLSQYHDEDEQQQFFQHVQIESVGQTNQSSGQMPHGQIALSKVTLSQLSLTIKRLCPKTVGLIYQDIFEKIWAETKKNNMSMTTITTVFYEYDFKKVKDGWVTQNDFYNALTLKLRLKSITTLDIQVIAKRYKTQVQGGQDVIQYEKFFQDYERFEQLGLKAGFDPLKDKELQGRGSALPQMREGDLSPEVQKMYKDTGAYCTRTNLIDSLCQALAQKDVSLRGTLSYQSILEVFRQFKMNFNTSQMTLITKPLPVDALDNSYSYVIMIELLFGKQKAFDVQTKYKLTGASNNSQQEGGAAQANRMMSMNNQLEISQRFKDEIEVKLSHLQLYIHQMSKGSYQLKEQEFVKVFKQVGIMVTSQDHELLVQSFGQLKTTPQQVSIDFRHFLRRFKVQDTSASIINALQKAIASKNLRLTDEDGSVLATLGQKETVSYEEFKKFLAHHKIDLIEQFTDIQMSYCFLQMAERRERLEKSLLLRILKNERDTSGLQQQEWLPFIVNEFIYHLVNNNINIYKFVNPQAKKLQVSLFNQLINEKVKFKPSNPKDLTNLVEFFTILNPADGKATGEISIEKLLSQIRKIDPTYAQEPSTKTLQQKVAVQNSAAPVETKESAQAIFKKLSQFSPKVKEVLKKINDQIKRNSLSTKQLFEKADVNKNGIIDRTELVTFFQNSLQVKGISVPQDIDLLFETLDMNKDQVISVNEFCLCLDGIQLSLEQKLRSFDPDLEKALIDEINMLFDFFDSNKDAQITISELQVALKAVNPYLTQKEIDQMMKDTDGNSSGTIDRKEFISFLLPKLKMEMLSYEQNFDDLRRLFKEFDADQSNYLSKAEFREALTKLNIVLSDVQFEDLMIEVDIDQNQVLDIDEFIAFLSIADQIKFKNPQNRSIIIKIKHAKKLQPIDFYNCFKNLPQFFQPSITQECLEKKNINTPSWGLYPKFDSKSLSYDDMQKLEEVPTLPPKKYVEKYQPQLSCEVTLEEATGIPLPRKEDYDWDRISNREMRIVLVDFKTQEFLSNTYIVSVNWKPDHPSKWLFNATETHAAAKQLIMRTDLHSNGRVAQQQRDIHLLIECVLFTTQNETKQQICCAWGSIPASQLDKQAKHKVTLKGGSPYSEMNINKKEVHQEKKGFDFLKKLTATTDESQLILSVKPFSKLTEQQQLHISMLPSTCVFNKRLLSFLAAFRLFTYKKLTKSQQQMIAPNGSFAIAQFRKIFDNPDVNLIMADCWESYETSQAKPPTFDQLMQKMEEFLVKLYAIIYTQDFHLDHVYPTRSLPVDSELFLIRESMIKLQLAPLKYKKVQVALQAKKPAVGKENTMRQDDYKPFNISEMEIEMAGIDNVEAKTDELTKMYQQMGLLI